MVVVIFEYIYIYMFMYDVYLFLVKSIVFNVQEQSNDDGWHEEYLSHRNQTEHL